jgi:hypothetical protein
MDYLVNVSFPLRSVKLSNVDKLCRVGWAYPLFNAFLPQYLEHAGKGAADLVPADVVYLNYLITSVAGVPGSFIACYTVDLPRFGRKGTMAASTVMTAISLFMFTVSGNSAWQTFAACIQSFFSVSYVMFFLMFCC